MLSIKNLSKAYAKSNVYAVSNLSLELRPGEVVGFLGSNGAGKSTTLKCLTGILPFSIGRININGYDIQTQSLQAKTSLGYVPDNHFVYEKLTGIEYLNFMADMYNVPRDLRRQRIEFFAHKFSMMDKLASNIKSYSHGMRQKICVMGSLLHNPKLWVLDEPLTGLDPQSSYRLKQYMKEHAEAGNTVFFSSHVLAVVEQLCDSIAIIDNGHLIVYDRLENIKSKLGQDANLEQIFLKLVDKTYEEGGYYQA
ncbi:MAG: ABC transporter ATP-binding protein [Firmicutes bacterium]|nr:ABC transporter ATP-binding protein [Bacillota bacterium]